MMLIWTRMGWLVPVIWLGAVALSGQLSGDLVGTYGMGLSQVSFVFLLAAVLSTPLLWLAGAVLNRTKVPTTIRPLGREREVLWGTHTFYFMPFGYWAVVTPVFTVVLWAIFRLF